MSALCGLRDLNVTRWLIYESLEIVAGAMMLLASRLRRVRRHCSVVGFRSWQIPGEDDEDGVADSRQG